MMEHRRNKEDRSKKRNNSKKLRLLLINFRWSVLRRKLKNDVITDICRYCRI